MQRKSDLFFSPTIIIINYMLTMALNLMLTHQLGTVSFGDYSVFLSLSSLVALFAMLGRNWATIHFIPSYIENHQYGLVKGFFLFNLQIVMLISLCLSVLVAVGYNIIVHFLGPQYEHVVRYSAILIPLISITTLLSQFLNTLKNIIPSLLVLKLQIPAILIILICLLTWLHGSMIIIHAISFTILSWMTAMISLLVLSYFLLDKRITKQAKQLDRKNWFLKGLPYVPVTFCLVGLQSVSIILLKLLAIDQKMAGVYATVFFLADLVVLIFMITLDIILPEITPKISDKKRNQANLNTVFSIFLFMVVVLAASGWLLGKPILNWFGTDFERGYIPMCIIIAGNSVNMLLGISTFLLQEFNKNGIVIIGHISMLLFSILLGIVLIPYYSIEGAAVSVAVPLSIMFVWQAYVLNKEFEIKVWPSRGFVA